MSLKRRLAVMAISAGLVAGFSPLVTAPAVANQCDSPIQLFFWHGAQADVSGLGLSNPVTNEPINTVTVGQPIGLDHAVVTCIISEDTGQTVDGFYIPPGALLVSGRDNASVCQDVQGTLSGLGLNVTSEWRYPRDPVDGSCNPTVGTSGASSARFMRDPATVSGTITGSTNKGSVTYKTLDR